ncbi:MAG TPA: YDG domain-containing protein, partial [Sphingobacteriaceae bacterium]
GSGRPMRFADLDGTLIDCYQVPTQITDESDISSYTSFMNSLLDKAKGPEGYFGVFCANMHTDNGTSEGSDEIINSAMARQIPVVSAKQMLDWLDGRNNSSFGSLNWLGNQLRFSVSAAAGSRNMKGMLPDSAATGKLTGLALNGSPVPYTIEKIKGISYAFFDAVPGNFEATYGTAACLVTHPADTTVTSFTQARFKAGSTDAGATYQWQVSADNGATYTAVQDDSRYAGSRDRTLVIGGVTRAMNNYRYRCIISGVCPVTTEAATLSVDKAVQTITWAAPAAITYGTVLDAQQLNASVSGVTGTVTGALTYTPAAGTLVGAGLRTLTVTAAATDDYLETTGTVSLTVDKAVQTITWADPDAITYGTILDSKQLNASVSGIPGGTAPGALTYTPAAGTRPGAGIHTLAVTAAATDNYLGTTGTVSLNVQKRPVSAQVTVADKTYDGSVAAQIMSRSLSGVLENDQLSLSGGTAAFTDRHAATMKEVTISGLSLTGPSEANYILNTDTVSATASIAPLNLQGSFTVADKAYSGTTSAVILNRALNGALAIDSVSLWGGTAEFNDASVGTGKTVTATGVRLGGSYPGNYRLEPAILTAQANITPRSVTGSIKVSNKVYDGNTDAEVSSAALSGLLAADAGKVALTGGTARFTSSTIGSKRVLASGFVLSGAAAGNYSLLTPSFSATASITKRPVTVTARAGQSKVAGAPDPVLLYDITSGTLVDGDQFSGSLTRTSGEAAGIYPILKGSLALNANYELTFQSSGFLITDPVATTTSPDYTVSTAQLRVTPSVHLTGYPNPFAGQAVAEFRIPWNEAYVNLAMYDLRGQKVSDLYAGPAGTDQLYRFTIRGSGIPPGAYFIRLTLRNQVENFKIIMLE